MNANFEAVCTLELNLFWIEEDPPRHQPFQGVFFPLAYFLQNPQILQGPWWFSPGKSSVCTDTTTTSSNFPNTLSTIPLSGIIRQGDVCKYISTWCPNSLHDGWCCTVYKDYIPYIYQIRVVEITKTKRSNFPFLVIHSHHLTVPRPFSLSIGCWCSQ